MTVKIILTKSMLQRELTILCAYLVHFKVKYSIERREKGFKESDKNLIIIGGYNYIPSGRPIQRKEALVVRIPVIGMARGDDLTKGISMTKKASYIAGRVFSGIGLNRDIQYKSVSSSVLVSELKGLSKFEPITFDFETTGLNPTQDEIIMVAIRFDGQTYVTKYGDVEPVLKWLVNCKNPLIVCNATFEQQWFFAKYGKVANVQVDVQVDHCLTDEEDYHGLSVMAGLVDMWGYDEEMAEYMRVNKCKHHEVKHSILSKYAAGDVQVTYMVSGYLEQAIIDEPADVTQVRSWLVRGQNMLARVMHRGMYLDRTLVLKTIEETNEKKIELEEKLGKLAAKHGMLDFNAGSAPQRAELLYKKLGLPVLGKTKLGNKPATDAPTLEKLKEKVEDEVVNMLIDYASLKSTDAGLLTRCLNTVKGDCLMRSNLSLTKLLTGQISSTEPPMQNVHKTEIRKIFTSRFDGGSIHEYDYNQLHLRIIGNLAQCEGFIDAYLNDVDLHSRTTASVILQIPEEEVIRKVEQGDQDMKANRKDGKQTNFSIIFEVGSEALSQRTNRSKTECKEIIHRFLNVQYQEIGLQINRQHRFAEKHGYVVSPMGRIRHLPDAQSNNRNLKFRAFRQAGDYLISNSGRYITLYGMIMLDEFLTYSGFKSMVIMQVHDSVVLDVHPDEEDLIPDIVQKFMVEEVMKIVGDWMRPIPLTMDGFIGKNWYEGEAVREVILR